MGSKGSDTVVSVEEVQKHSMGSDCWIVVEGQVWDITEFAPEHPGGPGIIYKYAGHDATEAYNQVHELSLLAENLDASKYKGQLDSSTITEEWAKEPDSSSSTQDPDEIPPLEAIINAFDFEDAAKKMLPAKTWAFYSSAATDCVTRDANRAFFDRVWWRPRVLRNVQKIDTRSRVLGNEVDLPLWVSSAAMAKMIHPEGEKALARACTNRRIMHMISTNASFKAADIVEETPESQPSVFQLYFNKDRQKTNEMVDTILSLRPRIRAIAVTVDAAVPGKREADERLKVDEIVSSANSGTSSSNDSTGGGIARTLGSFIDASLSWEDLKWLRGKVGPDYPLFLKGIQCAADAKLALAAGMQGIVVSNHGGRSLDTAPPVVVILLELQRCCPEVFDKMEVWVDGGIRRGTDILKCLCLGATAVGIGRTFLYSLTYGQEGAEKLIDLLKDEVVTAMRLVGISDLSQAHPDLINSGDIDHMVPATAGPHPYARKQFKARI